MIIHVFLLVFFGLLMDMGEISVPGVLYSTVAIAYLILKTIDSKLKGFPVLTRTQSLALWLLPLYGPSLFIFVFHIGQKIRYGY